LASKGFVTLALAFFGVDHLPEAALDWLAARDEVCTENGVGLSGISQVTYLFEKLIR